MTAVLRRRPPRCRHRDRRWHLLHYSVVQSGGPPAGRSEAQAREEQSARRGDDRAAQAVLRRQAVCGLRPADSAGARRRAASRAAEHRYARSDRLGRYSCGRPVHHARESRDDLRELRDCRDVPPGLPRARRRSSSHHPAPIALTAANRMARTDLSRVLPGAPLQLFCHTSDVRSVITTGTLTGHGD